MGSATAVIVEEGGDSFEDSFSAKTIVRLTFANRAQLEIRGEVEAEDETEDIEGAVNHHHVLLWGFEAPLGIAPVFRFARRALVTEVFEWGALRERWSLQPRLLAVIASQV